MDRSAEKTPSLTIEDAKRMAGSDAGKKLYTSLQNSHGQQLQEAMAKANAGDLSAVRKTVAELLDNPEVQAFLRQMGGSFNG